MGGEITAAIKGGLRKSAKEVLEHTDDLKKKLDNLVIEENNLKRKLTNDEIDDFFKHFEDVASLDNIAKNLDSIKLSKLDLENWIKVIRKLGGEVRYNTSSKKMMKYFKEQNCGACFDPWEHPPIIWIRKDVTDLEMFHESMHFEDFLRRGKENYIRREQIIEIPIERNLEEFEKILLKKRIPERDQLISTYIKEKYVLEKILEEQENWIKKYGKGRFSENEIQFSIDYLKRFERKCVNKGIDISKLKTK